jgi:pimeloyl-ACP methyl ester carboxylesterase
VQLYGCGARRQGSVELAALSVPTLIIQGDADASAPLALTGARTAALIPNCRLIVYENAPHGLYLTHRDRLNRDLLTFVEGDVANESYTPDAVEQRAHHAPAG